MPTELIAEALEWSAEPAVPNGLLLLAALTRPATWSRLAVEAVRSRLAGGGGEQGGEAAAEGERPAEDRTGSDGG